jgi:signal transduction histidine kinase/DNA-binding NarL/FixJ family response regulator
MGISRWLRAFSTRRSAETELVAFSRAAAAGGALPRLLELAAGHLLSFTQANRVGVWLESPDPAFLRGTVVDSNTGEIPSDWGQLHFATFPWQSVLRTATVPIIVHLSEPRRDSNAKGDEPTIPVLAGMQSAVWWPVRTGKGVVGLVLLAFRQDRSSIPRSIVPRVWSFLDQLALAFRAHREHEAHENLRREHLQHSTAELQALLESVDCGVLLLDSSGQIRALNEQFARLFGLDESAAASLAGHNVDRLLERLAPTLRVPELFAARWRQLSALGDSSAWEEVELESSGRVLERLSRPVFGAQGQAIGWLEVFRQRMGSGTSQQRIQQTEKMAAIGQLVSGIAHELNNPLTSILGYTQLLLARFPASLSASSTLPNKAVSIREVINDAEKIRMQAERAGRIVKNLLLFARGGRAERRAVSLNEVVERTLALRSYELKIENIQLDLHLHAGLPLCLADPYQLQQVALNLLVNAEQAILESHAAEQADATAATLLGKIRIRTFTIPGSSPARAAIEVSDSGPGVPPEIASRLFDPFFTTKPLGLGTGLGLSIAYGIIRDHGGEIYLLDSARVASGAAPLRGATFVVELPVFSEAEIAAALQPHFELPGATTTDLQDAALTFDIPAANSTRRTRARILVVEDEPTVAQLISDVLEEDGHVVDVILDSREGLARAGRLRYDLIICDLRMPRMDGRAFYHSLIRSGHHAHPRMMFVTGDTLSPRTMDFLSETGLPCLAKPFLVEELKSIVYRALDFAPLPGEQFGNNRASREPNQFPDPAPSADESASPFAHQTEAVRKP